MAGYRLWIVAADAGAARIFERLAANAALVELEAEAMRAPPASPTRGPAPRVHDRMGPGRHSIEKRVAPHEAHERKFLDDIIVRLEACAGEDRFDQLVLCAPARAAGLLRKALGAQTRKRLKRVVVKDLTHESLRDIEGRLPELAP